MFIGRSATWLPWCGDPTHLGSAGGPSTYNSGQGFSARASRRKARDKMLSRTKRKASATTASGNRRRTTSSRATKRKTGHTNMTVSVPREGNLLDSQTEWKLPYRICQWRVFLLNGDQEALALSSKHQQPPNLIVQAATPGIR